MTIFSIICIFFLPLFLIRDRILNGKLSRLISLICALDINEDLRLESETNIVEMTEERHYIFLSYKSKLSYH